MSYQEMSEELKELAKEGSKFAYVASEVYEDGATPSMYQYRKDSTIVKFSLDPAKLKIVGVNLTAELPVTGYVSADIFYKDNQLTYASASQKIKPHTDTALVGLQELLNQIEQNEELQLFVEKLESVLDWVINVENGVLSVAFAEGGYIDFPLPQFDLPDDFATDQSGQSSSVS